MLPWARRAEACLRRPFGSGRTRPTAKDAHRGLETQLAIAREQVAHLARLARIDASPTTSSTAYAGSST